MLRLLFFITIVRVFNPTLSFVPEEDDNVDFESPMNDHQRIVGGRFANRGEFPFNIELRLVPEPDVHHCGGSLYNEWTVITAAHCVFNIFFNETKKRLLRGDELTLIAGQYSLANPDGTEQVRHGAEIHKHEKYGNSDYDIAVVVLDSPFEINENVKPIPLATEIEIDRAAVVRAIGWGFTSGCFMDRKDYLVPDILKTGLYPLLTDDMCLEYDSGFETLRERYVCGGAVALGSGGGDSGGPNIITLKTDGKECTKLIGPTSYGINCKVAIAAPSFFVKAATLNEFIERTAKGPGTGKC